MRIALAVAILAVAAAGATRPLQSTAPRLHIGRAPLFSLTGLQPGDRAARCFRVSGRGVNRISIFGGGENGPLVPYLHVRILRGCGGDKVLFAGRLGKLPSQRRAIAVHLKDVGETGNTGSSQCLDRTRRDSVDPNVLCSQLAGQVAHRGFERRFRDAHHFVVREHTLTAEVGEGEHAAAAAPLHQRQHGARQPNQ